MSGSLAECALSSARTMHNTARNVVEGRMAAVVVLIGWQQRFPVAALCNKGFNVDGTYAVP